MLGSHVADEIWLRCSHNANQSGFFNLTPAASILIVNGRVVLQRHSSLLRGYLHVSVVRTLILVLGPQSTLQLPQSIVSDYRVNFTFNGALCVTVC